MNQIVAIALGGAIGAVLRFLVSSGVYSWLGRGMPYGTLVVNVAGSFLAGLLTEALILQRVAISQEFRAAILIGLLGAFTTFSTFTLETLYLIEKGTLGKAIANIGLSVFLCLAATWGGLLMGRVLFSHVFSGWVGGRFPYGIVVINCFGAFMIGLAAQVLIQRTVLAMEYRAAILVVAVGVFTTFSTLYLVLSLIEHGQQLRPGLNLLLQWFMGNTLACLLMVWFGVSAGKAL